MRDVVLDLEWNVEDSAEVVVCTVGVVDSDGGDDGAAGDVA